MQRKTLHKQYKKLGISAVRRIGFSFFAVILIGSILLSLPMSHSVHSTSSYLDHLFVATSATCVTGLVTHVTASEYTLFGQIVIILLIQIGGLGFLTLMSMFFVLLKRKLTYANKIVMQEALNIQFVLNLLEQFVLLLFLFHNLESLKEFIIVYFMQFQHFVMLDLIF